MICIFICKIIEREVLKEYQKMKTCMAIRSGYDTNVTYFPDRPRESSKKFMPCLRSHVTSNRNWWHSCRISGPWKSSSRLESGCNQNQIHLHVNRNLEAMVMLTLVIHSVLWQWQQTVFQWLSLVIHSVLWQWQQTIFQWPLLSWKSISKISVIKEGNLNVKFHGMWLALG